MTSPSTARRGSRAVLPVLFAAYLAMLVWLVLWKLHPPYIGVDLGPLKLVPFVSAAGAGSSAPREVLGNVLVFVPFGMYLRLLTRWGWVAASAVVAATSALLELTQFVLGLGVADVTDVIANTAGGLVGIVAVSVTGRGRRARTMLTVVAAVATIVAVAAICARLGAWNGPPLLP